MAERRMFTKKITDDENFMSLSSSAQALYFHLNMSADDDGFCNQISVSMFKAHASIQDLQALLEKRYILQFDNGVIVIKHWRMANALRKDRYTPTAFQEELKRLKIKENGSYTLDGEERLPDGCQMVAERLPQVSIGKDSIDKVNKESNRGRKFVPPTLEEVNNYISEKGLSVDGKAFLEYFTATNWIDSKGNKVKSWKGKLLVWNNFESKNAPAKKQPYMESSSLKDDLAMLEELAIKGGKA